MRSLKLFVCFLALASICYPSHHHHTRSRPRGQAGVFDFYMLVLSWSPEFCFSKPSAAECSIHAGFLVHGLWPQNNDGTYPSNCATDQPGPTNPSAMADIMPSEIIEHEWQTHGTCSGLSGDAYFGLLRKVFQSVSIPPQFKAPSSSFTIRPAQLKQAFEHSAPNLVDTDITIQLRGNYLNAVNICESHSANPAPVACSGVKDIPGGTFIVPPVR